MIEKNESSDSATDAGAQGSGEAIAVSPREPPPPPHNCYSGKKGYFQKPKNWVSLLTLAAVTVYTGITALMWCNSNRQLATLIEGNTIAQKSLKDVQRAFIVSEVQTENVSLSENGKIDLWRILGALENSGNTPARKMRWHFGIGIDFAADPDETEYPFVQANPRQFGSGVLPPRGKTTITNAFMDRITIRQYTKDRKKVFFAGVVNYDDAFNVSHITKFCMNLQLPPYFATMTDAQLDSSLDKFSPLPIMCKFNNCSDDDCKGKQ